MDTSVRIGSYSGPAKVGGADALVEFSAHCELDVSGAFEEVTWDGMAFVIDSQQTSQIVGNHVPIEIEGRTAEVKASGDFLLLEGVHEIRLTGCGAPPFEIAVV